MRVGSLLVSAVLLVASCATARADVTVYDDASRNGFNDGCSFPSPSADFDFANGAPVHGGTQSIRFTPDIFNAVSWCTPAAYSATTDFAAITFWVNLNASAQGQSIDLVLGNNS